MRRLHKFLMILTAVAALAPAAGMAQTSTAHVTGAMSGNGRGFGLGAESFFGPNRYYGAPNQKVPNLLLTWGDNGGRFHLEGLFGMYHEGATNFDFGGRGWYHIHAASSADFSVGGGLLIARRRIGEPSGAKWDFLIEMGAQMRVFVVSNVALLGSAGLGLYIPDTGDTAINISGDLVGTLGIAYYFM
jgi:hypothetical protein